MKSAQYSISHPSVRWAACRPSLVTSTREQIPDLGASVGI